ncbi:zwei Ig domain protein zig-8-like [Penaeus japonicus]|uniref:zwei Ig domain protein zig-8-like n=1 Tax=Penaeus japonicus TaxID=27405 RepID=UPI001C710411|nr:zwei Ig domain protein zig-8-like [Penaeus japonicus]
MFIILYIMGIWAVSAGGGSEEVDTTRIPADVTEVPNVSRVRQDEVSATEGMEQDEEPYFDASMSSLYTAYLGKTATLTCVVHAARTDKSVSWIRGRDLRILTVGGYTYTTDLRFEALHQQASSEWTLRIRSVQLRDRGSYECQIATKPIRTFNVFLKVVEPIVEVIGAPDIYVNTESMINLTCVVHHAPYPPEAITWYHGNQTISYTSDRGGVSVVEERGETTSSFLLLQNARSSDSGIFTCQPEGMESAQVALHVLDGERPAAMQTNSSSISTPRFTALFVAVVLASTVVL